MADETKGRIGVEQYLRGSALVRERFVDLFRKLKEASGPTIEARLAALEARVAEMEPKADVGWAYAEAFRKVFAEDALSYGFLGDVTASDAPEQQP